MIVGDPPKVEEMPLRRRKNIMDIVSSADTAYDNLCRMRDAARKHAALAALIVDVEQFEEHADALASKYGQSRLESLRDDIEQQGSACEDPEVIEQALKWCDLEESKDELAGAFVVVLQGRLAALFQAAEHVYVAARNDRVTLPDGCKDDLPRADCQPCWQIANYVKHHDQWPEDLDELFRKSRRRRTFEALEQMQLLHRYDTDGARGWVAEPRLVSRAVGAATASVSDCLRRLVTTCELYCDKLAESVQQDFAELEHELERARNAERERRKKLFREPV